MKKHKETVTVGVLERIAQPRILSSEEISRRGLPF